MKIPRRSCLGFPEGGHDVRKSSLACLVMKYSVLLMIDQTPMLTSNDHRKQTLVCLFVRALFLHALFLPVWSVSYSLVHPFCPSCFRYTWLRTPIEVSRSICGKQSCCLGCLLGRLGFPSDLTTFDKIQDKNLFRGSQVNTVEYGQSAASTVMEINKVQVVCFRQASSAALDRTE